MTHEDLTPSERAALERLQANAPDAPEALASLNDSARARVLKAFSGSEMGETSDSADDEPTLDSAPVSQSASPVTFADRVWEPTVAISGKQVPVLPASVGVVLLLVSLVLVVRACAGDAYSWCADLDDAVDRARTVGGGLEIINMVVDDELDPADDAEADALREAISDASAAAWNVWDNSEERSEAIKLERAYDAWEESLRDAC